MKVAELFSQKNDGTFCQIFKIIISWETLLSIVSIYLSIYSIYTCNVIRHNKIMILNHNLSSHPCLKPLEIFPCMPWAHWGNQPSLKVAGYPRLCLEPQVLPPSMPGTPSVSPILCLNLNGYPIPALNPNYLPHPCLHLGWAEFRCFVELSDLNLTSV